MSTPTPILTARFAVPHKGALPARATKIAASGLSFYYGRSQALQNISLEIPERMVTAFIGPSGCGKTTFLRTLNRMNDGIPTSRVEGRIAIDGQDIYAAGADVVDLRRKVGMVLQMSNP